ncbi:MAG TPA: tRNA pseudouridine synthase A, partial [Gaiellaceae bacterium]|nr:tRNA pseudouridine synthase A [Gaiellaceae bacterium]
MRLRLTLEYDGTGFRGWARQPGERTVEAVVRGALDAAYAEWSDLAVAGRTDTGVHATGQVVSAEVGGGPPVARAAEALNASLPKDVAVVAAAEAPSDFHARFSARARSYRYRVLTRRARPRRAAAALLPGDHDFTAFTPAETQHESFRRLVSAAAWERRGEELHFT